MSNSQPAPISGNHVINQILYLEIPENNSTQVDKCCIAGLGNLHDNICVIAETSASNITHAYSRPDSYQNPLIDAF